jgi:hypothetical protein
MTNQGDPLDPRRSQDYIDRAPSSANALPIIGGIVALGVLVLLVLSFTGHPTGDPVTPRSAGATAPTAAPAANTPTPAPAAKP